MSKLSETRSCRAPTSPGTFLRTVTTRTHPGCFADTVWVLTSYEAYDLFTTQLVIPRRVRVKALATLLDACWVNRADGLGGANVHVASPPQLPCHAAVATAQRRLGDRSGSLGPPVDALVGVGRPQVGTVWALHVDQRALVAQQVLPMGAAIPAALAVVAACAVIAARARQPCAAAAIRGRVNRQHESPSDRAAHLR